jgi:hypothetical protein
VLHPLAENVSHSSSWRVSRRHDIGVFVVGTVGVTETGAGHGEPTGVRDDMSMGRR